MNGSANTIPKRGNVFTGALLIVLGSLFLLDQLDVADFGEAFADWWPLIIIAVGAGKFLDRDRRSSGLWLIGVGSWLLVTHLGLFGLTWGTSWPILLILVGGGMLLQPLIDGIGRRNDGGDHA